MTDEEYIRHELNKAQPVSENDVVRIKARSEEGGESRWVRLPHHKTFDKVISAASGGNEGRFAELAAMFERQWVCRVAETSEMGAISCSPSDAHGQVWKCGYRWVAPALTEQRARQLGLIPEENA